MAEEKTKLYEVVDLPVKEQKGKKIPGTVQINEGGANYTAGMQIPLTEERMKALGKQYFKEVKGKDADVSAKAT